MNACSMRLLLCLLLTPMLSRSEESPSFRRDVMPVFFRSGCNQGTCHGSARGKDGFMLSLFGYDPKGDLFRIKEEMVGRRINLAVPGQSLLLLKATGKVPHTGGELFTKDSPHYQTLLRWIEAGAPDDEATVPEPVGITLSPDRIIFEGQGTAQQTRVKARYSDGSERDVSSLALFATNNPAIATIDDQGVVKAGGRGDTTVFARFSRFTIGSEVIVLPKDTAFHWPDPPAVNYIDELVNGRLQLLRLLPSDLCDDETFLRRVTLDLTGTLPSVDAHRSFMSDTSQDKRSVLIDRLLADPGFTSLWTALWAEMLRVKGGGYAPSATDVKAADVYYEWIHDQMAVNRPLDRFVADQITGTGSNLTSGPANLYTMLVHDVKVTPKNLAADISQLFTGVRIQCAECHNHPFDRWTMNDYYGWVSFFTGIRRKLGAEPREYYVFNDLSAAPAKHLIDERPMPPTVLGGEAPVPSGKDPREALAEWLTAKDNPLFARNLANRIWAHHMGRGLVEPLDDMRVSNPPTNGPLLDALARHLADSGFNLRSFIRDICNSRTYQLSARPNATNAGDTRQFSRSQLRRLRADVLLDSIVQATDGARSFQYFPSGIRAIEHYPRTPGDTTRPHVGDPFFETFGRSGRAGVCVCETKPEPTLSQALHLVAGDTVASQIGTGQVVLKLLNANATPQAIIEELYIRALSRKPTEGELEKMLTLVGGATRDRKVYEDLFWGLLNSTEFLFNH
ncbi:MAG: DUF1553 domain-containing protein [Verrucomicrobiales bacterium]